MIDQCQDRGVTPPSGIAFLLAQLGTHATRQLAARLEPVGLTPAHLGILRSIGQNPGLSQKALSERLHAMPSRIVKLLDELEERGLVERRRSEADRRSHELYIGVDAGATMKTVMSAVGDNDATITRALSAEQRGDLLRLLMAMAEDQGLPTGTYPGLGPQHRPRSGLA